MPTWSFALLLTLGFMGLLAFLSLAPAKSPPVRSSPLRLQKAMHVALYGVLAVLLIWTLRQSGFTSRTVFPVAWLLASGYGGLMELLQRGRPDRNGDWIDVVRNASGAAIGIVASALTFSDPG